MDTTFSFSSDNSFDNNTQAESSIIIDGEEVTAATINFSEEEATQNIQISYQDEDGDEIFSLTRPQAELNIFDPLYYSTQNPDVANNVSGKYQGANLNLQLPEAELPQIASSGTFQTSGSGNVIITNIVDDMGNVVSSQNITESVPNYTALIEHYVFNGAAELRDPSPLFDSQYYLEQNPDVASALAGGSFEGDPLLHYVSAGAAEGRDPNSYFDTSFYLEQYTDVANSDLNPLEHYVLYGASETREPSPNFDPNFYLSQNPDVAAANLDPLTHFLTFGQDEGRLPTA